MMPIFSSLTQQYRSRVLSALRRKRRRSTSPAPAEALEQRALLSSVTYSNTTQIASFDADQGEENIITISSPSSDTLVIQSQQIVAGDIVDDPITLQGNAAANAGFSLDATGSILTIDIDLIGSQVSEFTANLFDSNDTANIESSPASVDFNINGGLGDDSVVVGRDIGGGFRMDDVRGDISIDGGVGDDDIDLLDFQSSVSDVIDFRSSSVTGMSAADINYSNAESILVDTADRAESTLNILSTSAGVQSVADLTFEDASGTAVAATVTLGNTDAGFGSTAGNMDDILGNFELVTNSGLVTLQIDDSGDATGDTASISGTAVSGFSAGSISFNAGAQFSIVEVQAGSGDDSIDLSSAPTAIDLTAGDGNDEVDGSAFSDFVDAGFGDDTVRAGDGDDLVLGFDGNDFIDGEEGDDELLGENGFDDVSGGSGDDSVDGGDANDTLRGGTGDDTLFGGLGDDAADGDNGNDIMIGGDGDDTLRGSNGRDSITGGLGDDVLRGNNGRDTFNWNLTDGADDVDGGAPVAGTGADEQVIFGTVSDEVFTVDAADGSTVVSEAGGSSLTIGSSIEYVRISANSGDDRITVNSVAGSAVTRVVANGDGGDDRLDASALTEVPVEFTGGQGNDVLFGSASSSSDVLRGGAGNDTLTGGIGADVVTGGAGADVFIWNIGDGLDSAVGGRGDDRLQVSTSDDSDMIAIAAGSVAINTSGSVNMTDIEVLTLDTFAGADSVVVGDQTGGSLRKINVDLAQGPDTFDASEAMVPVATRVLGGRGTDSLIGGPGSDFLRGSSDDDTLRGGGGEDELVGDGGDDSLAGGSGHDLLEGGSGDDYLGGREGNDTIQAGGGHDRIEGGDGDDFIGGGNGKDKIDAGDGNDIVSAGAGTDNVTGGEGDDVLFGGRGTDYLTGNGGQDLMGAGLVSLTDAQLRQVRTEWISGDTYDDRAERLSEGDGALLLALSSDRTVRDDENPDTLMGNAGRDLFFADFGNDIVSGRLPSEDQIDLR